MSSTPHRGKRLGKARGKIPDMKNRLKDLRKSAGITQDEAAKRMGMSPGGYRKVEYGERKFTLDHARAAAAAYGLPLTEVLDGEPEIEIAGKIGANPDGRILFAVGQGTGDYVPLAPGGTAEAVALEVEGYSMRGIADNGSLIYYELLEGAPTPDMLGHVVVVETDTGEMLIKRLLRGSRPGYFDLESDNAPLRQDVKVVRAAHISAIIPPWKARQIIRRGEGA